MNRYRAWTPDDETAVRTMYEAGYSDGQIAKTIGATRGAVCARRHRMNLGRPQERREATVCADPRKASIWHLVDLKRAGYRGGFGELDVPAMSVFHWQAEPTRSGLGSPSALVAELGGV